MPIIQHRADLQCLVAVRGHPFQRDAFDALFQAMDGVAATMVDQPAAAQLMTPDGLAPYDALVLYDMPGLDFEAPRDAPDYLDPPRAAVDGLRAALTMGIGVLALHHAIAGWPTWDEYGEWLGGRFLYRPGVVRGAARLDSGYAHDVRQTFTTEPHPITEGLPSSFTLTDEPYLAEIFDDSVTPLLRSDAAFTKDHFYSASAAVAGRMYDNANWPHPDGSNLAGWTKTALNSPLVYLQPGDGPSAYEDATYRALVERALRWAAAEARRSR